MGGLLEEAGAKRGDEEARLQNSRLYDVGFFLRRFSI
jgi:hypothetical protein